MSSTTPDDELIALIDSVGARVAQPALQRQSEAALRALYDRTSTKLFGLAVKVTGNRNWAEDVLQEAFITVWRSAPFTSTRPGSTRPFTVTVSGWVLMVQKIVGGWVYTV